MKHACSKRLKLQEGIHTAEGSSWIPVIKVTLVDASMWDLYFGRVSKEFLYAI